MAHFGTLRRAVAQFGARGGFVFADSMLRRGGAGNLPRAPWDRFEDLVVMAQSGALGCVAPSPLDTAERGK
jgi:hypothetical protein